MQELIVVLLLLIVVRIGNTQYQYGQNSSQTSRYRDRQPFMTTEVYQYVHNHHNHNHNHRLNKNCTVINTQATNVNLDDTQLQRRSSDPTGYRRQNVPDISSRSKVVRNTNSALKSKNCTFGICDTVIDYPAERIANIINKSRELRQYFDELIPLKFENRFAEDEPMCPTMIHWRFPQSARNTKDVEMLLVNVDERYKQAIFYETCMNEGSSCTYQDIFPEGYVTTCTQKFTTRRLMAVEKESDQPVFDNFRMPSCCVCTVKKPSPSTR